MKKLALIGAGEMGKIIAKRAKDMGNIETHCFAWEEGAVAKEFVDYFYPISVTDSESILEKCKEIGVDGVLSTTGFGNRAAAFVQDKLNLIGNSWEVFQRVSDKFKNREMISNVSELKNPNYFICYNYSDVENFDFSYPVVVKPVKGGAKVGVRTANDVDELVDAFCDAEKVAKKFNVGVIIEEYIGGDEYSVESLSFKGKNYILMITEKENSGSPLYVELAHHQPADITKSVWDKIVVAVDKGLTAIGLENGACHTEVKVWNNEVYLIEFNPRPGGDHIAYPLTELSSGYPYVTGMIQVALDELNPINLDEYEKAYAGIFFVVEQTKNLKDVFDDCQNHSWCYEKHKVTDSFIEYKNNNGFRINYFIYCDKNKVPVKKLKEM